MIFDWLPDGRLIYSMGRTIFITSPYNTQGTPLKSFSKDEGIPHQLQVSPDGEQLAFTLLHGVAPISGFEKNSVWVMSIDNPSDLHKLATDGHISDGNENIRSPVWSPDGKWIMVLRQTISANAIPYDYLYAVPSDSIRIPLVTKGTPIRYYHGGEFNNEADTMDWLRAWSP